MDRDRRGNLWLRWVAANALSEMLGLGATFALGGWLISGLGDGQAVGIVLAAFAIAVASGSIEATLVGLAQHWAMRPWFPAIPRRRWWLATLVGALLGYVLGWLPTTLMNLGEASAPTGQTPMVEPPQGIVLLLAAGLGAAAGAVLSFAQWRVLRRSSSRAGLWIPANMLAWMVGMPLIFWGIDTAQKGQPLAITLLIMAGVLLLAGALVGAIHGAFLVRMMK